MEMRSNNNIQSNTTLQNCQTFDERYDRMYIKNEIVDVPADTSDPTTQWLARNGLSAISHICLQNDITIDILKQANLEEIKLGYA